MPADDPHSTEANPHIPPAGGRCIFNALPDELIAHVFLLGMPANTVYYVEDENFQLVRDLVRHSDVEGDVQTEDVQTEDLEFDFELCVSHTCRRWRGIALDTPRLWTTIEFTDSTAPSFTKEAVYLTRSRNAPIDVLAVLLDTDSVCDDEQFPDGQTLVNSAREIITILALLEAHSFHLRSLRINIPSYPSMYAVRCGLHGFGPAPILKVMELENLHLDGRFDRHFHAAMLQDILHQDLVPFQGVTPKLECIVLCAMKLSWSNTAIMRSLRRLYLDLDERLAPSLTQFSQLLHDTPNLATLALRNAGPKRGDMLRPVTTQDDADPGSSLSSTSVVLKLCAVECADFSLWKLALGTADQLFWLDVDVRRCGGAQGWCGMLCANTTDAQNGRLPEFLPALEHLSAAGLSGKQLHRIVKMRMDVGRPIAQLFMGPHDKVNARNRRWLQEHVPDFMSPEERRKDDDARVGGSNDSDYGNVGNGEGGFGLGHEELNVIILMGHIFSRRKAAAR
ncbi:hypothetical protein POSPLADRAFT_1173189 [Postia placenta MAD-698-R-SB12]|uniref:Uncharacterized protein n=1 Tax=Postia placenta MAD-698-R-SB12 TaxID=670580 RepID=A0A1X6MRB7_9APHY|nr:hypothetical protein POSPLADRAFT_1173189 [Postia placenta MAD-698-R-SB12]OSX58927.1 hypothetical protein POSPLADRAFT_1173189 [Postia placenta MAD-698-R-SB12]